MQITSRRTNVHIQYTKCHMINNWRAFTRQVKGELYERILRYYPHCIGRAHVWSRTENHGGLLRHQLLRFVKYVLILSGIRRTILWRLVTVLYCISIIMCIIYVRP